MVLSISSCGVDTMGKQPDPVESRHCGWVLGERLDGAFFFFFFSVNILP